MAISTYSELVTAVENWLHRSDLSARIPEFIVIGEARIGREVKARQMEARIGREVKARQMEARVSTTPTTQYVDLPSDYVSMRAIRVKGTTIGWLDFVTPDEFFNTFPSTNSQTSKRYTIFGDELVFPTTPTGDVELWYYKKLTALASATNSLFTANPDLYLYASLCAAAPFLGNDARVMTWEGQYSQVKNQLNVAHDNGRFPTGMRMQAA